mmetsp:Transcript_68117/g.120988  ORF Transcript_68117/g.120988 Transcript_68117/m.120988 type:complete len:89 (-) Transcript_68117:5-271(-)
MGHPWCVITPMFIPPNDGLGSAPDKVWPASDSGYAQIGESSMKGLRHVGSFKSDPTELPQVTLAAPCLNADVMTPDVEEASVRTECLG